MGLPSRHLTFVISFDEPLELTVLPDGTPPPDDVRRRGQRVPHHAGCDPPRRHAARHPAAGHAGRRPGLVRDAGRGAGRRRPCRSTPCGGASPASCSIASTPRRRGPSASPCSSRCWCGRCRCASTSRPAPARRRPRRSGGSPALDGRLDVATLAAEVGWSRRHLSGQFTAEYGVGPKEMARVLRFERSKACSIRPDRRSLATIAAECGYADQAHMAREWRASPAPARRSGWPTNGSHSSKTTTTADRRMIDAMSQPTVWPCINYRDAPRRDRLPHARPSASSSRSSSPARPTTTSPTPS